MKRSLIFAAIAASSLQAATAATDSSVNITTGSFGNAMESLSSMTKDMTLTLETETSTVRDRRNEVQGYQTYFQVEPGYDFTRNLNVRLGANYTMRQLDKDAVQRDYERVNKNSDGLDNVFLKVNWRASRFRDNQIMDIRLQARLVESQNEIFKDFYGNDGDYQFRAYFGRPLAGRFSINRWNSYLRYKKYNLNDSAGEKTRISELRARITPNYRPMDGMDLGFSFTYNRYNLNGNSSKAGKNFSEDVQGGPSFRYQVGPYAVMLRADMTFRQTDASGEVAENKKAGAQVGYAINFAAFL